MKQLLVMLIGLVVLFGCTHEKKGNGKYSNTGLNAGKEERIVAVVTMMGQKQITEVIRVIQDMPRYDSVRKMKYVFTDTLYGIYRGYPALDSLKRPLKAKNGKDSITIFPIRLLKDSVNTNVSNIPIDSLLKK